MSEGQSEQPSRPRIKQTFREYAPIQRRIRQAFRDAGAPVGSQSRKAAKELGREQLSERRKRDIDEVTGLPVRRVFEERLEAEVQRARRHGKSLVLVMVDVNDLKKINEDPKRGYAAGDEALETIANCLRNETRLEDFVARYGGDEDAVLLTEASEDDFQKWRERVDQVLKNTPYTVTACATLVNLNNPEETRERLGARLLAFKKENQKDSNHFEFLKT